MLKKGDWHESELVVNYGHDRSGQPGKKRGHELERGSTGRQSSVRPSFVSPLHLGYTWFFGKRFCKSNSVFFSTFSARVQSLDL